MFVELDLKKSVNVKATNLIKANESYFEVLYLNENVLQDKLYQGYLLEDT